MNYGQDDDGLDEIGRHGPHLAKRSICARKGAAESYHSITMVVIDPWLIALIIRLCRLTLPQERLNMAVSVD